MISNLPPKKRQTKIRGRKKEGTMFANEKKQNNDNDNGNLCAPTKKSIRQGQDWHLSNACVLSNKHKQTHKQIQHKTQTSTQTQHNTHTHTHTHTTHTTHTHNTHTTHTHNTHTQHTTHNTQRERDRDIYNKYMFLYF